MERDRFLDVVSLPPMFKKSDIETRTEDDKFGIMLMPRCQ